MVERQVPPAKAESEAKLLGYIRSALLQRYGVVNDRPAVPEAMPTPTPPSASSADSLGAGSVTNVQEAGVGEADRIKSDGKYLYVSSLRQPTLLVYETDSATNVLVAKIALKTENNSPLQGLYLQQNRLAAIAKSGGHYGYPTDVFMKTLPSGNRTPVPPSYSNPATTQLFTFDLSQPELPQQRAELSIDGALISSRMIGSRLYLATRHTAMLPGILDYPDDEQVVSANREKINQADLQDLLPNYRVNGVDKGSLFSVADCFVSPYSDKASRDIISLISVDVSSDNPQPQGQCFVGESETLYASASAVYLATTPYPWHAFGFIDDVGESGSESDEPPVNSITTDLHKFSLSGGAINYKGSAQVKGHLGWQQELKPFRMSEYQDVLRVVTYTGDNREGATATLHTLKENTQKQSLDILAELPNTSRPAPLGKPGEEIYATRFSGERGYLVTFRLTDPLYILNLSDPADPFIVSELEVDGYSDYLHPVGENFLLGIGKDAVIDSRSGDDNWRGAWYQGVKLSLIDITNPQQPYEKQKILLGKRGSNTAVSSTHHALTSLQRGDSLRVTLPLSRHEGIQQYNTHVPVSHPAHHYEWTRNELVRLEIDSVNGVITQHSPIISDSNSSEDNGYYWPYNRSVLHDRSVMIGDAVHYLHGDQIISREW